MLQDVLQKLTSSGDRSYAPTTIETDKYNKVRDGRNRFVATCAKIGGVVAALYFIPQIIIRRGSTALFRAHCRGRVLDLSPKVIDEASLGLYEASSTVKVEFLVQQRVVDDGSYRIDETLSDEDQASRRHAMTLDFLCKHDPDWIASPVSFAVVDEAMVKKTDFEKYDTVVVRHELCHLPDDAAEQLVSRGIALLKDGGRFVLVEVGQCNLAPVSNCLVWFHHRFQTHMYLSRAYDKFFTGRPNMKIVFTRRHLFGCYYNIAWEKTPL